MAKQNGELPPNIERVWLAVMASPRTCPICEELDGKTAEIEGNYFSQVLGRQVDGPGKDCHPQCKCDELIRRKQGKPSTKPEPERQKPTKPEPAAPTKPEPAPPPEVAPTPEVAQSPEQWAEQLSPEQSEAWEGWRSDDYTIMRSIDSGKFKPTTRGKRLRGEKAAKDLEVLKGALKTAPQYEGPMFRGLASMEPDAVKRLTKVGSTVDMKALSSWTPRQNVALGFAEDEPGATSVVLGVRTKNKGARYVAGLRERGPSGLFEPEILTPKGTKFRVVDVVVREAGQGKGRMYAVTLEDVI